MTSDPVQDFSEEEEDQKEAPPIRGPYLYFAIILLGILVFLVVFVNFPAIQASAGSTMTKTEWQLQTYADTSGTMIPATAANVTARFDREGRVAGSSGCNHYSATYTTTNYAIQVTSPATSLMYCPAPGVMDLETAYLHDLTSSAEFRVTDETLKMYDSSGKPLLIFVSRKTSG